jgi:Ca2+-binding EF-hand superfamily protein
MVGIPSNTNGKNRRKQDHDHFQIPSARKSATAEASKVTNKIAKSMSKSHIDRFVDRMFRKMDIDHDGTISFQEAYEGILKFYIKLNQQAPIPPPSREKVQMLYRQADKTNNDELNREEFRRLLKRAVRRAVVRLAAHKVVTIVGAPAVAEWIVRNLAFRIDTLERATRYVVPLRFHDKVIPVITSRSFHRTLWIAILVATLGNLCLKTVNFLLDLSLTDSPPENNKNEREWITCQAVDVDGVNSVYHVLRKRMMPSANPTDAATDRIEMSDVLTQEKRL